MSRGLLARYLHHPRIQTDTSNSLSWLVAGLLGSLLIACGHENQPAVEVARQPQAHTGHAPGIVSFPVSCSAPAQAEFNRAVALLHHMTYPEARAAFQQATALDTRCAMAHWGIAMTLFQPLWPTRPTPASLKWGWEEIEKAKEIQPTTEKEQLFIAAAGAFYQEPGSSDYWLRIRRWEEASEKLYQRYPNDPEAALFFALAHLATAPSNAVSQTHAERASDVLLSVHARYPDHPGSMHYLIHANDMPGREQESLEITRQYANEAPRNPHALHMPTHIYTRLGDWDAVIEGNLRAAEAALEHPAGDQQQWVWDEFAHAIEYLTYAMLQKGADSEAAAQLHRLSATSNLEPSFKTAFHLASTPARYMLERHAWAEAAALVPRQPSTLDWDSFAWPESIAQFAASLGAVKQGKIDNIEAAIERLRMLETITQRANEELFARNIAVLRLELSAWLAQAKGERDSAVTLMREAATLEASTPKHAVTPAPTLPAYEQLGDLFMELQKHKEALAAYQTSMQFYPRRLNSLLGAARAANALGDVTSAVVYYQDLMELTEGGTRTSILDEAKSYLAQHRI